MGKKQKKGQKKDTKPKPKSNIKHVTCVDCPQAAHLLVRTDECKQCEFHKDGYCKYILPAQRINIVSQGTPMKFNRSFFQSTSVNIADSTRNYYLFTPIMKEVRDIKGYPNYSGVKRRFLAGEFKKKEVMPKLRLSGIKDPLMIMAESDNGNPDIIVEGKQYVITTDVSSVEGSWEILYYLYDMFNLDGFADIQIQGRWYKVRLSPIEGSKEDYVVARKNNNIAIGRIQ